jgi:protein-disulfide isomerase
VKFVDYTLHGKKEFDENLNQYCIQKEEPAKFNDYLTCYVKSGDSAACATSAKIDSAKNAACISDSDKKFKLTENFVASGSSPFNVQKDLNDKYGVQGSPSLVINGQLINSNRDSASYLKTICSGFSNQPEECKAALSETSPTAGFGN